MKEEKPNFLIDGDGDHNSHIVPSDFFCVSGDKPRLNKRVILGKVENGTIAVGDPITIFIPGKEAKIQDHIRGIEINKKSVTTATEGERIGIRLQTTTIRQLRELNNNN